MINNPYTTKNLDISTMHITKKDADILEGISRGGDGPIVYGYDEGFFVYVVSTDPTDYYKDCRDADLSEEFIHLLDEARAVGCKYLQLDADGVVYDELPKFNW